MGLCLFIDDPIKIKGEISSYKGNQFELDFELLSIMLPYIMHYFYFQLISPLVKKLFCFKISILKVNGVFLLLSICIGKENNGLNLCLDIFI